MRSMASELDSRPITVVQRIKPGPEGTLASAGSLDSVPTAARTTTTETRLFMIATPVFAEASTSLADMPRASHGAPPGSHAISGALAALFPDPLGKLWAG